MNISKAVLQAMAELRHPEAQQIADHIGATLVQTHRALTNHVSAKRINCTGRFPAKGSATGGSTPAKYWLPGDTAPEMPKRSEDADKKGQRRTHRKKPMYASVFDYAMGISANDSSRKAA